MEKLEANQMIVEVDQGVAYVQFEKKLNIRSHIRYITTLWPKEWSLRKSVTEFCPETSRKMANKRPIELTSLY